MWNSWLHRVSLHHNWQSVLLPHWNRVRAKWILDICELQLSSALEVLWSSWWIGNKVLGVCECVHNERCELFPWIWPASPAWGHIGWVQLHVCVCAELPKQRHAPSPECLICTDIWTCTLLTSAAALPHISHSSSPQLMICSETLWAHSRALS